MAGGRVSVIIVLAFATAALATWASPASAIAQSSQITSPAQATFPLIDTTLAEYGPQIKVEGIAENIAEVDIRCYYGRAPSSYVSLAPAVTVSGGAFSASISRETLESLKLCRMRAVPHGNAEAQPPGDEADPYGGPLVATTQYEALGTTEYFAASSTLSGVFLIEQADGCALSSQLYTSAEEGSEFLFECAAVVQDSEGSPGALKIDGAFAYTPSQAFEIAQGLHIEGAPAIGVGKTFDEANGLITIYEEDPLVECSPEATAAPSSKGCTSLVSTGVTLEREWQETDANHVLEMTDRWKSTDGAAHILDVHYLEQLLGEADPSGVYEFPGSSTFVPTVTGDPVSLPAGAGTILYKTNPATPLAGNGENPQGAIVYDSSPSEPLPIPEGSAEASGYSAFEMPYQGTIAAGGSLVLRMAFIQAFALEEVRSLAEAVQASYPPSVAITSPAASAVTYEPPSAPPALPEPVAHAAKVGSVKGTNGEITVVLACNGLAGATCKVQLTATTTERLRKGEPIGVLASQQKIRSKKLAVGTITVLITAGKTKTVTITVKGSARTLLSRFDRLPVELTALLEEANNRRSQIFSQILTVKPPRKKHRR